MASNNEKKRSSSDLRSRIWLILIVLAMIAFAFWASGPIPDKNAPLIPPTSTPNTVTPKAGLLTPTPVIEIIEKTPTTGVIFGVIVVVLILVIGVLISLRSSKN